MDVNVIIASRNPVKIEAAKMGFQEIFPGQSFRFEGISVASGVSDQPMSNAETYSGAEQRALNARNSAPNAQYWLGIEGGIEENDGEMQAFAWIVILSGEKKGKSRTASFYLPEKVVGLVKKGMELGVADDKVFGKSNSKQKNGAVGILTGNVITRATYYREAIILALIPFVHKDLY